MSITNYTIYRYELQSSYPYIPNIYWLDIQNRNNLTNQQPQSYTTDELVYGYKEQVFV